MRRGIWAAGVAVAAALVGCGTGEPTQPKAEAERPAAEPVIEVTAVRSAAIERALQEQRGKVVFIDFWATT